MTPTRTRAHKGFEADKNVAFLLLCCFLLNYDQLAALCKGLKSNLKPTDVCACNTYHQILGLAQSGLQRGCETAGKGLLLAKILGGGGFRHVPLIFNHILLVH